MGRPKTSYTDHLRLRARPETVRALDLLSESTGLSRSHLLRLAVETYLCDMGLLAPAELPPTLTAGPPNRRGGTK
jgi:hypothetical protein